jgi:hypothetical protein
MRTVMIVLITASLGACVLRSEDARINKPNVELAVGEHERNEEQRELDERIRRSEERVRRSEERMRQQEQQLRDADNNRGCGGCS